MKKKVYICAPLGGNVKKNLNRVRNYTRYALMCCTAPVVPHFYALCLDDRIPKEREIGMAAGLSLLWFCDEMWIFGDEITAGMAEEIQFCKTLNVKTRKVRDSEIKKVLGGKIHEKAGFMGPVPGFTAAVLFRLRQKS